MYNTAMVENTGDPDELVPAGTARSISEADVLRALLQTAGIEAFIPNETSTVILPHLFFAINRRGVPVLVRARDVEAAREVLKPLSHEEKSAPDAPDEPDDSSPNDAAQYAQRAARSAVFAWLFPPLALWTLYCMVQALRARAVKMPADPRGFTINLWCAALFGIGIAIFVAQAWWRFLS